MKYLCELEVIEKGHVACIRTRCNAKDIPAVLGDGYGKKIYHYLQSLGLSPNGMPYTAYFNMDMNDLDIELGMPVSGPFQGTDEIISGEMAAGSYATTVFFTGPYGDLEQHIQL